MPKAAAVTPFALSLQKAGLGVRLSMVIFALSALFLWSLVLQAPLRFGLAKVHLDALIYLPKLLLLAAIVFLPLLRPRTSAPALMVSALAVLYLVWGAANLPSLEQAAFGLWVLVPLLFGLWAGSMVRTELWGRLFLSLFIVAALGVFLNTFIHYPWIGQTLDLLGKQIEVSRQWSAFGIDRYAGFARASFNAASELLLFGIMLVVLLKRRSVKLLVWLITGAGIALTTSKGALGAWLVVSMYFAGGALLRWPRYWIQLWLLAFTLILLAMILMPLSSLWVHYDPNLHGYLNKFLFASFGERLDWMWPDSLHLLNLDGAWHWWVGRGLGGIGAAQQYFEPARYLAGDNLFVYVTVYVGLPVALLLFAALWWHVVRLTLASNAVTWRLPVILALVAYGVVMNGVEEDLLVFFWGLVMSMSNRAGSRGEDRLGKCINQS
ncbi:hypothetical protein [Thioalkalivibrio sulfidiphilus]|uniref:hypothetical protein n=1 Tax=Thioalkalivibrio sulfidiphilus TaxID=1033854 RepID=UPI003B2D7383